MSKGISFSLTAITCILFGIGLALAAFVYQSTTQVREALAQETLEQQYDVAKLIEEYDNVLISIERCRLRSTPDHRELLTIAVAEAENQLEAMRSTYSFAQLDGAAKAHSFVKPVIEDVSQWTSEGLYDLDAYDPVVLELAASRMRDRLPAVRAISADTHLVADELISEQTDFLGRFRDSMLVLLFGFALLSLAIAALLVRQRNLQTQLARDQETNAQKLIDAETRGRLQAESALVGSEQFLRATLNSMHSDIAILDSDGSIKAVNTPWRDFVSENDQRYIDGGIGSHYKPVFASTAILDQEKAMIEKAIVEVSEVLDQRKDVMSFEYPRDRDNERQWSLLTMYTFHTNEGRFAVLEHCDVSERKQLEERDQILRSQLAHSSRLSTAGELASGLAHELNQPLTAITHNCDAVVSSIRKSTEYDAELKTTVNDISEQAQRAGSIIRSMRQLVHKDSSDKIATDINELVRETVRLTGPEARDRGVNVMLQLAVDLPKPVIDPIQIQQVLVNLERNSVEAMWQANSEPRQLTIRTLQNDDSYIEVWITDTGPGIEPDFVQNLFTAFQTTKPEGMGLGLSISRSIVENHGGRLWSEPKTEGVTTFKFAVPLNVGKE